MKTKISLTTTEHGYEVVVDPDRPRNNVFISMIRWEEAGSHIYLGVWNFGGKAGELTIAKESSLIIIGRMLDVTASFLAGMMKEATDSQAAVVKEYLPVTQAVYKLKQNADQAGRHIHSIMQEIGGI